MGEPIAEGWVTISQAAEITGYHVKYLRRLAGQGRIEGHKVNRGWLLNVSSLLAYKAQMDRLGDQKHNPQREDLAADERGRERE
jgi:excisionase family DNA binding protein